jgi:hypothetical protein
MRLTTWRSPSVPERPCEAQDAIANVDAVGELLGALDGKEDIG